MNKYTPGPWIRDPDDKLRVTTQELLNAGDHIATVETYADSRLIAAAPELLEALEELLYARTDKAEAMANAAIAKAKGEV